MDSSAFERRAANHGHVIAGELVLGEQFAHLQLDQFQQLLVVHHVDFVEEDHHRRHLDLARQQDVLARLGHRAVGRADHQDGAIHLGGAGDHVLDVVGVARAVHMRVVPLVGLVLDVGDRDGDAALALLGRLVDLVKGGILGLARAGQHLGDRRRQRRLAVVNVPDRAHVHMRLVPHKLLLRHRLSSPRRARTVARPRRAGTATIQTAAAPIHHRHRSMQLLWVEG